ncbi:MAG: hypothetical protein R3C02_12280 [Planctomycetaceae bacterium]
MAESTVEYLSAKAGFVRDPDEYDEDRTANGSRRRRGTSALGGLGVIRNRLDRRS